MNKFTYNFEMPGVAATMVLFYYPGVNGKPHIVLGKRKETSVVYPGEWCLPGGYLNTGTERMVDVARRETMEEVGIEIPNRRWNAFFLDDEPGSDSRYVQVINHCYCAMLTEAEVNALTPGDDIVAIKIVSIDEVPKLAFAHNMIIDEFIKGCEIEEGK